MTGGATTALLLSALAAATAQPALVESVTIGEMECSSMVQRGAQVVTTEIPEFRVIERSARDGPFVAPELPPGTSAIMCPRSSIVPAPNDWKVLAAGYALALLETRGPPDARRAGVLEMVQGRIRFRLLTGELGEGEEVALQARLNQLQQSFPQ